MAWENIKYTLRYCLYFYRHLSSLLIITYCLLSGTSVDKQLKLKWMKMNRTQWKKSQFHSFCCWFLQSAIKRWYYRCCSIKSFTRLDGTCNWTYFISPLFLDRKLQWLCVRLACIIHVSSICCFPWFFHIKLSCMLHIYWALSIFPDFISSY